LVRKEGFNSGCQQFIAIGIGFAKVVGPFKGDLFTIKIGGKDSPKLSLVASSA